MKVITYLGFTVLSIFIQFCFMDLIQEKIQLDNNSDEVAVTNRKIPENDLLKNITSKPHALYYRTLMSKSLKKSHPVLNGFSERIYNNSSLPTISLGTTEISTTVFEVLYDENVSMTETTPTTESFFTSTEFDNITEITFFEAKNKSSTIPNNVPKKYFSKYCGCNLLFKVCDINCCCDQDCTDNDLNQFPCKTEHKDSQYNDGCISNLLNGDQRYGSSSLESLFCIVKTNLPDRKSVQKPNLVQSAHYNKWKDIHQPQKTYEFKKTLFKQGDPIWMLRNGTIYYFDIPTTMVNNYCTDRAPIGFLREEKIQCIVKFNDLEMFHISNTEESMVLSAIESTFNSSTLNCSNLHCINWTILACDNGVCKNYNKSIDGVSCTESNCLNVALKIEYNFYCFESKILNATIKLHIQKILHNVLPFMTQEITVKFIMANKSLDHVKELSGNPGYINYLPIIISNAQSNFSDYFFNNTDNNYLILPENKNGLCVLSNMSENIVRFSVNRRTKCRYIHTQGIPTQNYTSVCKDIQDNIIGILGLDREVYIAPFGNPYGVADENWMKLSIDLHKQEPVSGVYSEHSSKLHCYNLINRVAIIFIFSSVDEKDVLNQNKILSVKYEIVPLNRSFTIEDISMVLTTDINFVDATKPNLYVYASSPHLNIHLPNDFFFPFPPNNRSHVFINSRVVAIVCCVIFFANKITLA